MLRWLELCFCQFIILELHDSYFLISRYSDLDMKASTCKKCKCWIWQAHYKNSIKCYDISPLWMTLSIIWFSMCILMLKASLSKWKGAKDLENNFFESYPANVYLFKVKNTNNRKRYDIVLAFFLLTLNIFHVFFLSFFVNFEQANDS